MTSAPLSLGFLVSKMAMTLFVYLLLKVSVKMKLKNSYGRFFKAP
jgi:hypothetical protein